MTPEIAARYQRTLDLFERSEAGQKRTYSPPMPFEVQKGAPGEGDVVELAYHRATITPERYYGKTIISKSRMWGFSSMMTGGGAFIFLAICLVDASVGRYLPFYWFMVGLFAAVALYARHKERTADRNACHIFERSTGKVYLYRCDQPHRVVDFYDLHFSTTGITTSGLASSSRLNIDLPDPQTGELESFGGFYLPTPRKPCASGMPWCATWTRTGPSTSGTGNISSGLNRTGRKRVIASRAFATPTARLSGFET